MFRVWLQRKMERSEVNSLVFWSNGPVLYLRRFMPINIWYGAGSLSQPCPYSIWSRNITIITITRDGREYVSVRVRVCVCLFGAMQRFREDTEITKFVHPFNYFKVSRVFTDISHIWLHHSHRIKANSFSIYLCLRSRNYLTPLVPQIIS